MKERFLNALQVILEQYGVGGTLEYLDGVMTEDKIETIEQITDCMEEEISNMQQ